MFKSRLQTQSITLEHLFFMLSTRPYMLLNHKSIFEVGLLLRGYFLAKPNDCFEDFERYFCEYFNDFVLKKYQVSDNGDWVNVLFDYEENEEQAFERLMQLYAEFFKTYQDKAV